MPLLCALFKIAQRGGVGQVSDAFKSSTLFYPPIPICLRPFCNPFPPPPFPLPLTHVSLRKSEKSVSKYGPRKDPIESGFS